MRGKIENPEKSIAEEGPRFCPVVTATHDGWLDLNVDNPYKSIDWAQNIIEAIALLGAVTKGKE